MKPSSFRLPPARVRATSFALSLPTAAAAILLLLAAFARNADAAAPGFQVKSSEKMEALLLLDALANLDPDLPDFPAARSYWFPLLDQEPAVRAAYDTWKGAGSVLCYLLADGGDSLSELVTALDTPEPLLKAIGEKLDEPNYRPVYEHLAADHAQLKSLLRFLLDKGFPKFFADHYAADLEKGVTACREQLAKVDADKFRSAVGLFVPRPAEEAAAPLEVVVTLLSGIQAFALPRGRMAISVGALPNLSFLLPFLVCRKFVPSQANLDAKLALVTKDPYYETAHRRIYTEMHRAPNEEFVYAAALHVSVSLGLLTRLQALRMLKFAHGTGLPPDKAGAPLATALFGKLADAKPAAGFDYNAWLAQLFQEGKLAPGGMRAQVEQVLAEILGIAGISIRVEGTHLVVQQVYPGFPAADGGVKAGDELLAIGGTPLDGPNVQQAAELLAGARGDERVVRVRRGEETLELKFKLK
ncbi:MAG: PDZ domain-containing protein [Planctomycetes bacterium]|nr:PDZ domain-containing protein [Planctomycetota bacterium]